MDLANGVLSGDVRAVARAISVVENGPEKDRRDLMARLAAVAPVVVGVTGAPGTGKSTLTSALVGEGRRAGRRIAVVAVDPSSPFSGGAVLGDRIRMNEHAADPHVFIRSMATRGHYGGLAAATADAARVLAAAGYDRVFVETVGVGQSEVEIMHLARCVVLVLMPGAGDGIQSMKSGVMEIADVFALNKSDLPGIDRLEREVAENATHSPRRRRIRIVRTCALTGEGVPELDRTIETMLEETTCASKE